MPREMAREVLAFARHLQRKHAKAGDGSADWDDDDSRFGAMPNSPPTTRGTWPTLRRGRGPAWV